MVDGGHFPPPPGEYKQRTGVEGEVDWHGAQRAASGEQPVFLGCGERRVKAVVVYGALPERTEKQCAVGGLDKDFPGAKTAEKRSELCRGHGGEGTPGPAQRAVTGCHSDAAVLGDC